MDILIFGGCLLLGSFIVTLLIRSSRSNAKAKKDDWSHLPRPPDPNTLEGNHSDMDSAGSLYQYLTQLHREYGEVVHYRIYNTHYVSTYTPEGYQDLLKHFDKPGQTDQAMDFIRPVFGSRSIQFTNGEEAKYRRQRYDCYFNSSSVRGYFPLFVEIADEMVASWRKSMDDEQLPVHSSMIRLMCKTAGITMFGDFYRDDHNVEEFEKLYEEFWPLLEKNFTQGMPEEGTEERAYCDKVIEETKSVARRLIEARNDAKERLFIDEILETCLDDDSKVGDTLIYLFGGIHNPAIILTWCLYYYSKHPEVKARIDNELHEAFPHNEALQEEDQRKLPYLRQFIDETLRISFAAPLATRAAMADTNIRGYKIPSDSHIVEALSVTLMHPDFWEHPDTFNPERLNQATSKGRHPLTFTPFGFGRRPCPARNYFYVEALVLLSTLFRHFDFEVPSDDDVDITYGFMKRPTSDIWMTIKSKVLYH